MLNLPRIHSREANLTAIGVAAVSTEANLPDSFFEGMTTTAEEAKAMAFRVNVSRSAARNRAKARMGIAGVLS